MDQNSSNGTDKRNWRERLGIGSKELPRVSEEFRDEDLAQEEAPVRAVRAPAPVARPAPMAPRSAPKAPRAATVEAAPIAPRRVAPIVPDALAEKLKVQRAAAERLAEQRVQAARARAEAANAAEVPASRQPPPMSRAGDLTNAPKPKFAFADEEPAARVAPPPMPQRQAAPPPPMPQPRQVPPPAYQPQMQSPLSPPRPSLGGERPVMPQRTMQQPMPPQQPYQSQYRAPPPQQLPPQQGYRPIDPATGYPAQPSTNPAYNRQQYGAPPQQSAGPRLGMPATQRGDEYANEPGFEQDPRPNPRMMRPPMRPPLQAQPRDDEYHDDVFEQPAVRSGRRASANEYTQAYREVETGYDEEPRGSRIPLILSLVGLALVAGLVGWYFTAGKSANLATNSASPPVIEAPEQPAKVSAEPIPETQTNAAAAPSKKQIYDRIVGDQEVLGGQLTPTEETPVQPETQSQPIPEPAAGNADEALPLPLPPPPGNGAGTQGALPAEVNQTVANVTPASANIEESEAIAPAPGDLTNSVAATSEQATPPSAKPAEAEEIADVEPVIEPKKKLKPTVAATEKPKVTAPKNLGAKPVVLVPPVKKAAKVETAALEDNNEDLPASVNPMQDSSGAGLATSDVATPAAPKKKRTLADLFRGEDATPTPETQIAAVEQPEPAVPAAPAAKKVVETPTATVASGYVVQLASFKSQAEANAEYKRMTAKHSGILGGLASNINQATVAGSTRYRLALGPLSSRDAASQVCSKLFAAGERDCLIRKQ